MLWALVEGLAGVVDRGCAFDAATISPRWLAAGVDEAEVSVGYAASRRGIGYQVRARSDRVAIEAEAEATDARFHVLLPPGAAPRGVRCEGRDVEFRVTQVEQSTYADFALHVDGALRAEIGLR